jgi:hypothetical protein
MGMTAAAAPERVCLPRSIALNSKAVGWRKVGDDYVVVHMGDGAFYVFHDTSAAIWQLLVKSVGPAEIVHVLHNSYDVEENVLARDLLEFLKKLESRDLIKTVPDCVETG